MTQLDFTGRTALVTGAASGIGRATALMFAARGALVTLADLDIDGGRAVLDEIAAVGGQARFVACDVSRPEQVEALVHGAVEAFGRLDCAFNNAGITQLLGSTEETELDEWRRILDIDLTSVFYCMKHEIAAMKQTGGGTIVNNSSDAGLKVVSGIAAYSTAKYGVVALTRTAARETGAHNIRINAVCPGATDTPMMGLFTGNDPTTIAAVHDHIPMRRFARPKEIAQAVLWLCSDASSYVTGAALPVDGGLTA